MLQASGACWKCRWLAVPTLREVYATMLPIAQGRGLLSLLECSPARKLDARACSCMYEYIHTAYVRPLCQSQASPAARPDGPIAAMPFAVPCR